MKHSTVTAGTLCLAIIAGCAAWPAADATPNVLQSAASATSQSDVTFSGSHGIYRVGSDVIENNNGVLTINGVPYGNVGPRSVVRYTVRGDRKILSVDGVVRRPQQPAPQ